MSGTSRRRAQARQVVARCRGGGGRGDRGAAVMRDRCRAAMALQHPGAATNQAGGMCGPAKGVVMALSSTTRCLSLLNLYTHAPA
jgi:hypothetical protein